MNPARQFWALFKFQTSINPATWVFPLVFAIPLFLPLINGTILKNYHPGFFILFMNQNLFFVGIIGAMILAPEKFQFGAANLTSGYYGSEFLLTRAIDRPVLFRAKAALLFALVLIIPFITILHSLADPDLVVEEDSKQVQQHCLATVPGSALLPGEKGRAPTLLAIPRGNILVAEWQFCVFLLTALFLQVLTFTLYPVPYAKWIFWTAFFGLVFTPLFLSTREIRQSTPSLEERFFFLFAGNQLLFLSGLGTLFMITQLGCERRYAQLEQ